MTTSPGGDYIRSSIGSAHPDRIVVGGRDLAAELMGEVSLTELAHLLIRRRLPTPGERRVLDTALVALADHGLTPSALAARLTHAGAPEAMQASVAAGLLGAGSVFLGPAGDTAEVLSAALATITARPPGEACEGDLPGPPTDEQLLGLARRLVRDRRDAGLRTPGLGHPVHREQDPRTPRIYEIAAEEGLLGPHLRLLRHVADAHAELAGRRLPVNGAGAAGAALADAGLPPVSIRGFVLVARTAGLVAHLVEEAEHPIARRLASEVEQRSRPLR